MCGIAAFSGEDRGKIERMTHALVHRGPDGNAVFVGGGISLGHARLAILDPTPAGDQPMWNEDHTVVIVYNGEIFNFKELRERYRLQCRTGTDTEVLLKLYEAEGTRFVSKLLGMFAFALYDTRTKTWLLARDSSGIKPLFLSYPNGQLHCASEMRALMQALPKKPALNMRSVSQYLRLQYVPGPQTLCEGIESLPPGTLLTWRDGQEHRQSFAPSVPAAAYASPEKFRESFPALMDTVVRDHLVSDKPVGIFLSGGMDSSIVLHHMSKHAKKPLKTFTVRFEASEAEGAARFNTDADLAKLTAGHYGTEHRELFLTAELYREHYKEVARALDQPNADSVSVAQFLLAREAKKHVDVVLNGSGGDELFGGYPRYRIARILQAMHLIPGVARGALARLAGQPSDVLRMSPGPLLAERLLARPIEEIRAVAKSNWFDPLATTMLFTERFASVCHGELVEPHDAVRSFMEFDRHLWLVDESLRLTDATTMGSGLECRVPFLDPRIIAASHATKSEWHVTLRRTKALLKETYKGILPDHLFSLAKASFYPPLAKWIRRECAPLVEDMLESARMQELFDTRKLRDLFEAHKQGEYHLHILSSLIQLNAWLETVYDA